MKADDGVVGRASGEVGNAIADGEVLMDRDGATPFGARDEVTTVGEGADFAKRLTAT